MAGSLRPLLCLTRAPRAPPGCSLPTAASWTCTSGISMTPGVPRPMFRGAPSAAACSSHRAPSKPLASFRAKLHSLSSRRQHGGFRALPLGVACPQWAAHQKLGGALPWHHRHVLQASWTAIAPWGSTGQGTQAFQHTKATGAVEVNTLFDVLLLHTLYPLSVPALMLGLVCFRLFSW